MLLDQTDDLRRHGRVEQHAVAALIFRFDRLLHAALAAGKAAADADKHRHIGNGDGCMHDTRLRREGVDGNDAVSVDVADGGGVGGKNKGFQVSSEDGDAAAAVNALRNVKTMISQLAVKGGDTVCHKNLLSEQE